MRANSFKLVDEYLCSRLWYDRWGTSQSDFLINNLICPTLLGTSKGQLEGSYWRSQMIIFRHQLDQKIMRVCISYTHLYTIKSLNHTLPSRKCKLCFVANMHVASTLWPDIKSHKLSECQFRLRWTKSDATTQFKQVKTGQPQHGSDKEAQDSLPEEVRGQLVARVGRPTYLVGRPSPWSPPPQPGHVASPHWSPTSVVMASPSGSLL